MVNKLLLRALLTLLIGTQSVGGTVLNVNQMVETIATTNMSEAEMKGYLQGMGVNLDTVEPSYLEAVYAQSQNSVGYFLENNPRVTEAVETIIDAETGEISIEPITAENIGGVEYTQKGFVGATTNSLFIASLLADWGLSMYGNWQYDNDNAFKSDYNKMAGDNVKSLIDYADYFRQLYPNDEKKAYEAYKAYASGNSPRIAGDAAYDFRTWLDDEDIDKAWNGQGSQIDISKYCNPDQISTKSIWRVWVNDAQNFWADGISQFFNRKEVDQIAEKVYEQGVDESYDITYDDISAGETVQASFEFNAAIATQVAHMYNTHKHSNYQAPISLSDLEEAILRLQITSNDDFIELNCHGYTVEGVGGVKSGTTVMTMYVGNANDTPITTYNEITELGNRTEYNVSGNFRYISLTKGYNSTPYFSEITRNVGNLQRIPLGIVTMPFSITGSVVSKLRYVGASGFVNEIVEKPKTSLVDWLHSNLKFPSIEDLKEYLDGLPSFKLKTVNPKTGEQEEQDWIKIPFIKRLKDSEDEYYSEEDLQEDIDFNDEDELPDYSESAIVHREEKDDIQDYKKPYENPTYEEDPFHKERINPSPSDIIIPPVGTTPNTPSTTPTSGGSPVIVPPIVPVGGSSSALFSVYNPTAAEINSLGSYLWGSSIVELLSKFLQNPIDAVISLHQIYITPSISGRKNIKLGYLDSGVAADCVSNQYESLDCGNVFVPEYYNDARDFSPWTQVQIYLPFIGIVPLSAEDVIGSVVNVKYGIDVYTGALLASVTVTKPDGSTQTLYTYEGSGCVQYPLTGANMNGIIRGTLGAMTGGMIGGVSGALVGGLTGTLSGGATVSRSGGFGGNSGAMGYKKPYIIITRKIPDDAFNYAHYYGLPANRTTTLVNCSGYTRVKNINVVNIPNATQTEKEQIELILKQGVMV